MLYDEEVLEQINNSINLVEYAEQTFDLTRKGINYFTQCPLHEDNTPSLCFNSKENFCHCFSCAKGGKPIKFLMDFEGLSFDEAVQKGMKLSGIDVNSLCKSDTLIFLRNINKQSKKQEVIEHKILDKGIYDRYSKEPIKLWLEEGISQEQLDRFEIRIDKTSNRIVYPVYDLNGNLINIKGRTTFENYKLLKIPKYINYYPIGVMDYFQCLNVNLTYIKEKKEVIIFESIKSVMKCADYGYYNCVSAEKHNLTPEQEKLLISLRVNIVFAYDSDISYFQEDVKKTIDKLKRLTNVYTIFDGRNVLGGKLKKNAPVDLGKDVWEELYKTKRKVR